jgi:hypothetical protein
LTLIKEFAAKEKLVMPEVDPPSVENCHRRGGEMRPNYFQYTQPGFDIFNLIK